MGKPDIRKGDRVLGEEGREWEVFAGSSTVGIVHLRRPDLHTLGGRQIKSLSPSEVRPVHRIRGGVRGLARKGGRVIRGILVDLS